MDRREVRDRLLKYGAVSLLGSGLLLFGPFNLLSGIWLTRLVAGIFLASASIVAAAAVMFLGGVTRELGAYSAMGRSLIALAAALVAGAALFVGDWNVHIDIGPILILSTVVVVSSVVFVTLFVVAVCGLAKKRRAH